MNLEVRRTHDLEVYLKEQRYEEPKELFKILAGIVKRSGAMVEGSRVFDFGCAAGEFLYYMRKEFPSAKYIGYDVVPELIDAARQKVQGVDFRLGSVTEAQLLTCDSIDVAFMAGVHSIFDEFESCFSNLFRWVRPGGRLYVVGLFNPSPIDVWVKYRRVDDPDLDHREPGWNIFSKASVSRFIDSTIGPGNHSFTPFEMPFDLESNAEDPVRSWTFIDGQGRRLATNGLSLICNIEILEVRP